MSTQKKYTYTIEDLNNALSEVRGGAKVRETERKYGIPHGTFMDKLKNKSIVGCKKGPSTNLTEEEENLLTLWTKAMVQKGMPVTPRQLADAVEHVIKADGRRNSFNDGRPKKKWFKLFLKRHPDIVLRKPEALGVARALVTERALRDWHETLGKYVNDLDADLLRDPDRIWNADESGFFTNPTTSLVIAPKGCKDVYEIKGSEKEMITTLANFSASGIIAPPCVVYPYERIPYEISSQINPIWCVGRSKKGWMTAEAFHGYVANTFLPFLKERGIRFPILFLIDGHKSHISYEVSTLCEENRIILYSLLPNSTHITQPADVGLFGPLKRNWKKVAMDWKLRTNLKTLTRANFAPLLEGALNDLTVTTIQNSFRKCGLHPFNVENIDFSKCISHESRIIKPCEANVSHLLLLESLFPSGRLQQFRLCEGEWNGDDEAKELFIVWNKLRKRVESSGPSQIAAPQASSSDVGICVAATVAVSQASPVGCSKEAVSVYFTPTSTAPRSPTPVVANEKATLTPSSSDLIIPSCSNVSPAFAGCITWPGESPTKKNPKARKRVKFPSAVGGGKWKEYWEEKAEEKKKKEEQKKDRERKKEEREALKASKQLMKRKKDDTTSSDEAADSEREMMLESEDEDWDDDESVDEDQDCQFIDKPLEENDFVLVKFATKKTLTHYVGKVMDPHNFRIDFLRKHGNKFVFPAREDKVSVDPLDIVGVLPPPINSVGTKRQGRFFQFKCNFSKFTVY